MKPKNLYDGLVWFFGSCGVGLFGAWVVIGLCRGIEILKLVPSSRVFYAHELVHASVSFTILIILILKLIEYMMKEDKKKK